MKHVAIPFPEALGHFGQAGIERRKIRRCRIVCAEPDDPSNAVRQVIPGLADHPEAGLLRRNRPLVDVFLPFVLKLHRAPAVGQRVAACSDILRHIKRRPLKVVTHHVGHILQGNLLAREDIERQLSLQVVSQDEVQIAVGIHRGGLPVGIHQGKPAVGESIEYAPDAGLAGAGAAEINRIVGIPEAEILILPVKIPHPPGERDHVLCIETVVGIVQREAGDAGLVGMGADGPVGNPDGHPDNPLAGIDAVADRHTLPDHLEYPGLFLVGDRERLALGAVAVFVGQFDDDVDGFPCGLGALEREAHQRAVIQLAAAVHQLFAPAESRLGDDDLMIVDIAHHAEGLPDLGNVGEVFVRFVVIDLDHVAFLPPGRSAVIQVPVGGMRVRRVTHQGGSVHASPLGDDDIGAGVRFRCRHEGDGEGSEEQGGLIFVNDHYLF